MWEFEHFLEYGIVARNGTPLPEEDARAIRREFEDIAELLAGQPPVFTHRDYHSRNLMVDGVRLGVIDFQDALMGAAAYDLASLLQDARVDVPEMMEIALLSRYVRARMRKGPFEASDFARGYATLAAQRASKILGIFARLERRDHKPQYLRHMPRVWNYLQRSLAHPDLAPLAAWYRANVPALKV